MARTMVRCDECGAVLDPKGLKNRTRTEGELTITFFQCMKCGKEYVALVMNPELEQVVKDLKKQRMKVRLMKQKKLMEKSIRREEKRLERMQNKALKIQRQLKADYEGRPGENGQAEQTGAETGDPTGVQNPSDRGDDAATVSGCDSGGSDPKNGLEQDTGKILLFRTSDAGHTERSAGGSPEED